MNRGAPEDPYASEYNRTSRSTARKLSSAQQLLTKDEVLKDFDKTNFAYNNGSKETRDNFEIQRVILTRKTDGRFGIITIITDLQKLESWCLFNGIRESYETILKLSGLVD